ncbi:MAG: SH3 domain-containing protein [Polyangiaceae bacterium]|nr:SH3 domain-containing protein [Polyangiaceae bacterium]
MALLARKDKPLQVELPSAKDDRALTSKVGLVAALGFIVGVAWPRVFGVEVGPDAPGSGDKAPAAAPAAPQSAKAPGSASEPEPSAATSATEPDDAAPSNKQTAVVGDGTIRSCKNKKGDKLDECGKLALDRLVKPRLAELSSCPSAIGLEGKLKLGIAVNFDKNDVVVVEDEKSSLPSSTVRGVMSCAGKELEGIELDKLTHTHARYTVAYEISFLPPGQTPEDAAAKNDEKESAAKATVTWEKALVRETEKEGKVIARLPQGTRVKILEEKDDWFKIESGKTKGWVYRQAIGK